MRSWWMILLCGCGASNVGAWSGPLSDCDPPGADGADLSLVIVDLDGGRAKVSLFASFGPLEDREEPLCTSSDPMMIRAHARSFDVGSTYTCGDLEATYDISARHTDDDTLEGSVSFPEDDATTTCAFALTLQDEP